ncbi:ferredoxin--NADP reductase [Mycolicibacterium sediminis]|uniref:Ferredoxin n=1 Tax=Mycolicibacterium sediminis TaxID=1286180 RepID=A0A7I7QY68_9MYCO|nr:ferredoxin--NADP reductase [Mycolicibacterium sediminis]BBY30967.1 ferredoxin [Mycolicibacterium sediminis]
MASETEVDGFAPLRIARVVRETADAVSLVLDVPEHCARRFRYQAGQFLTLRVTVGGRDLRRCYSMSSAPVEDELRITVKRDPGGVVSNWINDTVVEGDEVHVGPPEGRFVLRGDLSGATEVVAFAGGSGITPIMSLARAAVDDPDRRVRVFYANRSRESVIFARPLDRLVAEHGERVLVHKHFDEDDGVVTPAAIEAFIEPAGDAHYYVCGPGPFMEAVEESLLAAGVKESRLHLERFTVAVPEPNAMDESSVTEDVVIELDRKKVVASYRRGDTLLQTARSAGLRAPASCETGSCGTCMARIVEGSARMLNNDALDDDEVDEGWVLTCQSLPTSRRVRMTYE